MRWLVVLLALFTSACLPKVPRQRLTERARVAVAYVVDPSYAGQPFAPPEALKKKFAADLDDHNLEIVEVPLDAIAAQKLSDSRFNALKAAVPDAPFYLLVEQRVHFFSQLDGRYRWEVGTTLTAARADGSQARDQSEIPVILLFDHEKQKEAIAAAADDLVTRVGQLMDGVMAGSEVPKPPTASLNASGIYFVMVDRFENGDSRNDGVIDLNDEQAFHGGDLKGVINRLDWIQSMGFDTVWLSPIFKMRPTAWNGFGAFHGYWTWELDKLEPRFGDELLLAQLRSELDRRKMKLVLDVVLNHVGPDAPMVVSKPGWFHRRGGVTNWNDEEQLTMNDVHGLPDLATEKPEVFAYLLDATRRWLPSREA
ncbi:MAG: alpha-amylase family glycosyl hydrolase [Archangium sp.]